MSFGSHTAILAEANGGQDVYQVRRRDGNQYVRSSLPLLGTCMHLSKSDRAQQTDHIRSIMTPRAMHSPLLPPNFQVQDETYPSLNEVSSKVRVARRSVEYLWDLAGRNFNALRFRM